MLAPLHYRALQRLHLQAVTRYGHGSTVTIHLTVQALADLEWWVPENQHLNGCPIQYPPISFRVPSGLGGSDIEAAFFASAARAHEPSLLDLTYSLKKEGSWEFTLSTHISPQDFPSFPGNLKICVVQTTQILQPYSQSGEDKEVAYFLKATCVLYSTYKAISSQSLSWWLSKALRLAGIELGYTSHSTRGASISAATAAGLSVELIFEAADWASAQTFKRFYHREQSSGSFSRAVLKS